MVTSTQSALSDILSVTTAGSQATQVTASNSSSSFAQQLAGALESYLNQSPSGSSLEIDITPQQSQDSGARQFLVTLKDPASASPASSTMSLSTPTAPAVMPPALTSLGDAITVQAGPMSFPAVPADLPDSISVSGWLGSQPAPPSASTAPPTNEADAYWAGQPPAVQALRDISDFSQRVTKAWDLANQGYSIDTDIMVYHDDPWKTMMNRAGKGYNWVPALGQDPVLAPGISFPGMKTYEPNNPPNGSIMVNTNFAQGLEQTSPWWVDQNSVS